MNRVILKTTHNAGFFSCCTDILRRLTKYNHDNKQLPILDSSEQWELYKDNGVDDVSIFWFDLVKSKTEGDITSEFFNRPLNFDEFEFENFSTICSYPQVCDEDQYSPYNLINYDYTNKIIDTYFRPSNKVVDLYEKLLLKYNIDLNETISVLYRGNDKRLETNLPNYDEVLQKTLEVKTKFPNHKILVQSDEIDFCNYMKTNLPEVIIIDETKKIAKSDTAIQYTLPKGERVQTAVTFLSVMMIISNSSQVILNSGNVGLWVSLFRKKFNGVHQFLSKINSNNRIWIQ
jgi:hypothetical protein